MKPLEPLAPIVDETLKAKIPPEVLLYVLSKARSECKEGHGLDVSCEWCNDDVNGLMLAYVLGKR